MDRDQGSAGDPVVSIDFLFTYPTDGMTAGGIFPALLGTVWLVAVALLFSVPLGVAAALYLSEYAPDNWFTRLINLMHHHVRRAPRASNRGLHRGPVRVAPYRATPERTLRVSTEETSDER